MPMPRDWGGTNVPFPETTRPPIVMRPRSARSRPATQRSVVVFPHPEGPSSV